MKKLLLLCLFFSFSVRAEGLYRSSEVAEFAKKFGSEIIAISNSKKISKSQKSDKIVAKIDESTDSEWISRFVLGKNYRALTDPQKSEFKRLYRQFMIKTYGPKLSNYGGEKFEVKKTQKEHFFYLVDCELHAEEGKPNVLISLRIKERKGKLKIIDFIAQGISLIETQRSEFDSAISQNGIEKFIADLREKVANL